MGVRIIGLNGSPFLEGTCSSILKKILESCRAAGAFTETVYLKDIITAPFHGIHNPTQLAVKKVYDILPGGLRKIVPSAIKSAAIGSLMPEPVRELISKMELADGFVFITPTWWSAPSGYMMTLIHYLTLCDYRDFSLEGKAAVAASVCEEDGAQHSNMLMINALTHMGMAIPPFGSFFYHRKMIGCSEDQWQENDQMVVGANLVLMAQALKGARWAAG